MTCLHNFKRKDGSYLYFQTSVNILNYQTSAEKSLEILIDTRKVLQLCKINHGNYLVKLVYMPDKNCFQKVFEKICMTL